MEAESMTNELPRPDLKAASAAILQTLEQEREREIISRRFGLYDRRETLEQIGELLGITRERVRQLEKSILAKMTKQGYDLPLVKDIEAALLAHLHLEGGAARVKELISHFIKEPARDDHNHITFLGTLAPNITVLSENDDFHQGIADAKLHGEKDIKEKVTKALKTIKKHGEPLTVADLHKQLSEHEKPEHARAIANLSKHITHLKDMWGFIKWPLVNPKNIRDKIYVILAEKGDPMHFNELAKAIRDSDFKRKDVTTQAIHNELIKDKRFILIGRGIYALKEWGYKKGTVSDVIAEVLRKNGEPMHRDEIVKAVLKRRIVKDTTILLNLQGKPQFKRVAKATYALDEAA